MTKEQILEAARTAKEIVELVHISWDNYPAILRDVLASMECSNSPTRNLTATGAGILREAARTGGE